MFVAATVAGATTLAPASAHAQARTSFEIPAQPLEGALLTFAEQAHVSLALPNEGLGDANSAGLRGSLSTHQALERLLAGSGFRFEEVSPGAYRILRAPRPSTTMPRADDIVITARRRTPLQEQPRSLTDVDGDRLDQTPARDSHGVATQMSGVLFTDVGVGRDKIYIRGVSDGALTGRAQSTVGIYLDGVRLTYAAPDPQLQLVDIRRVDVLRGPQGALYGAGSIGGILSFESNAPDASAFYGSALGAVETTRGGGVGHNAELVLNAPVIDDRLAVRLAAYDQRTAGWLDNTLTGSENTNAMHRSGIRLSGALDLTPDWRVSASLVDQAIDSEDSQYLRATPSGPERNAPFREPHDNDFISIGGALHGSTRFGDIDSTTALVRHDINSRFDATGGFSAVGVNPLLPRPMDERSALRILVHETRLTSPAQSPLPWFVGFFYADGDTRSERTLHDGAAGAWPLMAYTEQRTDDIHEVAIFGETTWRLAPNLTLSTGLRLFEQQVKTSSDVSEPLLAMTDSFDGRLTERGAAPDIRLAFQPSDSVLLYLSAAEGYRSGGFNSGELVGVALGGVQPFRLFAGDELWTYELGGRFVLLQNRLQLSAALFYNDWRRLQTDDLISNDLPFTGNVGESRAWGLEADATFNLNDDWTLESHLLLNEPDLTQSDVTFPVSAENLPGAPELVLSGALRYERPLAGPDVALRAELSVAFVGESASAFAAAPARDSYTQADMSVGLSARDTDILVYAANLLDDDGATFSEANPYASGGPLITQLRPFSVGVQVRRRF